MSAELDSLYQEIILDHYKNPHHKGLRGDPSSAGVAEVHHVNPTCGDEVTLRVKVEPKSELKARMGQSPDMADAAFVALDLARQRHGLVAVDPPKQSEVGLFGARRERSLKDLDVVGRSSHAHLMP